MNRNKTLQTKPTKSEVKLGDGLAVAWEDITERNNTEAKLLSSESIYRIIAKNLPNGAICIFDHDLRYLLIEGSEFEKKGYPKEVLEGRTIFEVLPKYICDTLEPYFKQVFQDKRSHFNLKTSLGTYEIHTVPLKNEDGRITHGMAVFHNITELKNVEEKLLELNKNKDKFFSIISHDLRSPFTGLIGCAEILVEDLDTLSKDQIKQYSELIEQTARKLYNLLENLLQWSRIQSGRMEFTKSLFSINELFDSISTVFHPVAAKKRILLVFDINSDHHIYSDKNMLSSIIQNLLSNAIKFTSFDGRISVSVSRKSDYMEFCVEDNGVGIPNYVLEKLFKIEEHISTAGTMNETGSGLGLILCKEFLEKNGGQIWVESETGIGTKFSFTLPLN